MSRTGLDATPIGQGTDRSPAVFISYRRNESRQTAVALAQHLRLDLTSHCVFRDEDDLIGGQDWRAELETAIAESDAVLVLAGTQWAGGAAVGHRRIDRADDPVRSEVREALRGTTASRAVPVLLDGADPPSDLPDDIGDVFDSLHRIDVTRTALEDGGGSGYHKVLASVWEALRARIPNGFLVIGREGEREALDAFVDRLRRSEVVDEARSLSRCYAGAYVLSRREAKKALATHPDAIILVDEDAGEEYLKRIAAYTGLRSPREVKLVGSGAALALVGIEALAGGAATKAAISTATEVVRHLAPAQSTAGATGAVLGVSAKVAAAVVSVVVVAGGVATGAMVASDGARPGLEYFDTDLYGPILFDMRDEEVRAVYYDGEGAALLARCADDSALYGEFDSRGSTGWVWWTENGDGSLDARWTFGSGQSVDGWPESWDATPRSDSPPEALVDAIDDDTLFEDLRPLDAPRPC